MKHRDNIRVCLPVHVDERNIQVHTYDEDGGDNDDSHQHEHQVFEEPREPQNLPSQEEKMMIKRMRDGKEEVEKLGRSVHREARRQLATFGFQERNRRKMNMAATALQKRTGKSTWHLTTRYTHAQTHTCIHTQLERPIIFIASRMRCSFS